MKTIKILILIGALNIGIFNLLFSQTAPFNLDTYKEFLEENKDMAVSNLLEMYPAGFFADSLNISFEDAKYFSSIDGQYKLTLQEKELLGKNGFVVTERLQKNSFIDQFSEIWNKDLPVFISTDAILHAFHCSYDAILKDVELGYLIEEITNLTLDMHTSMPALTSRYQGNSEIILMLRDVDVYLTVPLKLLGLNVDPYFVQNIDEVNRILVMIKSEKMTNYALFSSHCKKLDFSQFTPRGHYTQDELLTNYFQAMMWFGRMELYLLPVENDTGECSLQTFEDIQRQVIDAVLIAELIKLAGLKSKYSHVEDIISVFVGEQDNVTLNNLYDLLIETGIQKASQLLDTKVLQNFQETLKSKPFSQQQILSQFLYHKDGSSESIVPASAFMLFGQRFVIDSYVTGNVVYDRIKYMDTFPCRLFPSTQDILFTLGNDASVQLLLDELEIYSYSSNLAGLRYLIDSYTDDFWQSSLYNLWLNAIRSLNPKPDRSGQYAFMQTAAWAQEKINTQLSSWTELRHDNLLYAKQSYTAGAACSFPYSFVEPIPEFYNKMKKLAQIGDMKFQDVPLTENTKDKIRFYFNHLYAVADTLYTISSKELEGSNLNNQEINFLKGMISDGFGGCYLIPGGGGWYPKLYYNHLTGSETSFTYDEVEDAGQIENNLVADYHTTPTDCGGNIMGWISHAGTGPMDMLIMTTTLPDNEKVAFIGPVHSYYEYRTTNFKRLTDEEWQQKYLMSALRPSWVNIYLADKNGNIKEPGKTLFKSAEALQDAIDQITKVKPVQIDENIDLKIKNYPNPFSSSTIISFKIPVGLGQVYTHLKVYDLQGILVRVLLSEQLPSGNYLTRWNRDDSSGEKVNAGIYILRIVIGNSTGTLQMVVSN